MLHDSTASLHWRGQETQAAPFAYMEFDEFRGTINTPRGGTNATNEGWPAAAITVLLWTTANQEPEGTVGNTRHGIHRPRNKTQAQSREHKKRRFHGSLTSTLECWSGGRWADTDGHRAMSC